MISLQRLKRLPPTQGLRKISRIFRETEINLLQNRSVLNSELAYLAEILDYSSTIVSDSAKIYINNIKNSLINQKSDTLRRVLNEIYHILQKESGHYPSEWDFDLSDSTGALDSARRQIFPGMIVYLEDIRSPFNVGAMFRTAESFGAEKLILSTFCADPNHSRAKRTAMGCIDILPWAYINAGENFLSQLPPETPVFALETGGMSLNEFHFPQRGIMIAGSEELGVSPNALAAADASIGRVSIPIYGAKGSLNVSVAFGIVMQAWAASILTSKDCY